MSLPALANLHASLLEHAKFLAQPSCPSSPSSSTNANPYSNSPCYSSFTTISSSSASAKSRSCGSYSRSQPLPLPSPSGSINPQQYSYSSRHLMHSLSQPTYSPSRAQAQAQDQQSHTHHHSPYNGLTFKSQAMKSMLGSSHSNPYSYSLPPFCSPSPSLSSSSDSTASPTSLSSSSRGTKRTIELPSDSDSEPESEYEDENAFGPIWDQEDEYSKSEDWFEAESTQVSLPNSQSRLISDHNHPHSFNALSTTSPLGSAHYTSPSTDTGTSRPKGKRWIDIPSDDSDSDSEYESNMAEDMAQEVDADRDSGIDLSTDMPTAGGANQNADSAIFLQANNPIFQGLDHNEDGDEDFLVLDDTLSIEPNPVPIPTTTSTSSMAPYVPRWNRGKTPDDDAAIFEELVRRTEAKRRYEATGVHPHSGGGEKGPPTQAGISVSEGDIIGETLGVQAGSSMAGKIHQDEGNRSKALAFLEQLLYDFLSDIDVALRAASNPSKDDPASSHNTSQKKRRKISATETQEHEASQPSPQSQSQSQNGSRNKSNPGINRKGSDLRVTMVLTNRKTGSNREPSIERFACITTIAAVLYEAIHTRTVVTLRDIYYRDKARFRRQDVMDKLVDDLVATAGLKRKDFYVCASAKGLIASSTLKIHRRSGEVVNLSPSSATLIDPIERIDRLEVQGGQTIDWVLVVEKDAVFQTLCSAKLLQDDTLGTGVMITGKGFPDLATRQMLRLIADTFPNARIYALVDADSHGLSILSTYKCGAKNTAHSHDHRGLALGDRMEWLGVKASDFASLGICYDELLPLEKVDVQLATNMLKDHSKLSAECKRELCTMLHLNKKAEIEIILSHRVSDQHVYRTHHQRPASQQENTPRSSLSLDSHACSQKSKSLPLPLPKGPDAAGRGDGGRVRNALVEYIVQRICQ